MTTPKKTIFLATDPFGTPLHQALLPFLREQGLDVHDLGTGDYYTKAADVGRAVAAAAAPRPLCSSSSSSPSTTTTNEAQGIVICGTGMGVCIAANKVPGIRAAVAENIAAAVNSKSVNNSNVLALGAMVTDVENAKEIVSAWLNAEFKGSAPANKGEGWTEDIKIFLEKSMPALAQLDGSRAKEEKEQEQQQQQEGASSAADANCCPVGAIQAGCSSHPFVIASGIEGAEWVVLRENPTRALVRFQKGSVEPSHYHTFGHDVFVTKGRKRVENLTRGETFEMNEGSYLYTKAGERHRVTYFEDTEFVLSCDGGFDVFWEEEGGNEGWKEDGKKKNAV